MVPEIMISSYGLQMFCLSTLFLLCHIMESVSLFFPYGSNFGSITITLITGKGVVIFHIYQATLGCSDKNIFSIFLYFQVCYQMSLELSFLRIERQTVRTVAIKHVYHDEVYILPT